MTDRRMTKAEALRRAAPVLAALVREDRERQALAALTPVPAQPTEATA